MKKLFCVLLLFSAIAHGMDEDEQWAGEVQIDLQRMSEIFNDVFLHRAENVETFFRNEENRIYALAQRKRDKKTLLHIAACLAHTTKWLDGTVRIMQALIAAGADKKAKNDSQCTPYQETDQEVDFAGKEIILVLLE